MENTWRFRVAIGVSLGGHMTYLIPDFCMYVCFGIYLLLQFEAYWFCWVGQPLSFGDLLILNNPSAGVGSDSYTGSWGSKLRLWCVQSSLYWCGGPFIDRAVSPAAKDFLLWSPHQHLLLVSYKWELCLVNIYYSVCWQMFWICSVETSQKV